MSGAAILQSILEFSNSFDPAGLKKEWKKSGKQAMLGLQVVMHLILYGAHLGAFRSGTCGESGSVSSTVSFHFAARERIGDFEELSGN